MADDDKRWTGARTRRVRLSGREIITEGLGESSWTDLHHRAMTVGWPLFVASGLCVFLLLNLFFAGLYALGDRAVSNATPGSLVDLFFFSVETLATVGYGDMHPQTLYGHIVSTAEIFTGMTLIAVMAGMIFSRFSRPHARLLFAKRAVVGRHNGTPALLIRVANARQNTISGATARVWLLSSDRTTEGRTYRGFRELKLLRHENPIFALSWTIIHLIDETSPLAHETAESLAAQDAALLLTVTGHDEQSTQELKARNSYDHSEIVWHHHYRDMVSRVDGHTRIDFNKMHDVLPEDGGSTPEG